MRQATGHAWHSSARDERGTRVCELAVGLVDVRLEHYGIDLRDHFAFFHDGIEVREELLDVPRDLTADLDVATGFNVPVAVTASMIGPRVTFAV